MSAINIRACRALSTYEETMYNMIQVVFSQSDAKFQLRSLAYSVTATDGSTTATSIMANLSGNAKELYAYFTTDAFSAMGSSVRFDILCGTTVATVDNVDINSIIAPLNPDLASIPATDADNAWQASLA